MTPTIKPTDWRVGTLTHIRPEAPGLRSFTFEFDGPVRHDAGQHYEIRLTAADGYQAARLYSAAMPANGTANTLQLTIALMPRGEVSSYLFNQVSIGDQLEIRGPLGRYFTWTKDVTKPLLLVGGGTGIVPLRAIRIDHQHCCTETPLRLLYSVKTYEDMAYKTELYPPNGHPPRDVCITFSARAPLGWSGHRGRIDGALIDDALKAFPVPPICYLCGPTPMVESVSKLLVSAGLDPSTIKTERFGQTPS